MPMATSFVSCTTSAGQVISPSHDDTVDAEVIEQRDVVGRRIPVRARLAVGKAVAMLVSGDHPELGSRRRNLGGEHLAIYQEAVRKDDRWPVPARLVEPDLLTVHAARA